MDMILFSYAQYMPYIFVLIVVGLVCDSVTRAFSGGGL